MEPSGWSSSSNHRPIQTRTRLPRKKTLPRWYLLRAKFPAFSRWLDDSGRQFTTLAAELRYEAALALGEGTHFFCKDESDLCPRQSMAQDTLSHAMRCLVTDRTDVLERVLSSVRVPTDS